MTSMISETPRPMPRKLSSKFGSALAIFEQNSNTNKEYIAKSNTNSVVNRNSKIHKKKETSETTPTTKGTTSSPHDDNEKSTAPAPVRRNFKIRKTVMQAEEPKSAPPKKSDERKVQGVRRNFKIDKTAGQTAAARVVEKFEATKHNESSSTCDKKQKVQRNFKIPKKARAEQVKAFEPTKIDSSSSSNTTNENNTAVRRNFKIPKTTGIRKQFDDSTTNNDSSATLQNVLHNLRRVKKDPPPTLDKTCDASPRSHRQEIELSTLSDTDEYFFDEDSEDGEVEYYELEISTDEEDDEELWEEKTVDTEEELWEEETIEEDIIFTDDEEGDRETPENKLTNLTKS